MIKGIHSTLIFLGLWGILIAPAIAKVFGDPPAGSGEYTIERVFGILTGAACWLTNIALVLMIGAIVAYGIQFLLSGGNPTKFGAAQESFKYAILGCFVIIGVFVIINSVAANLNASITPLVCH